MNTNKITSKDTKEIEQAISNILRGLDVESAALILEKCVLDNYVFRGGRVNTLKVAVRQILAFIENAKIKGVLDYAKENVKLKEELKKKDKIIDILAERAYLTEKEFEELKKTTNTNKNLSNRIKQYFERKVEKK